MENIIAGILAVTGLLEIYVLIFLIASPRTGKRGAMVRKLEQLNIFLALFFVMTLGAFFVMNGQAYADNITFDLKQTFGGNTAAASDQMPGNDVQIFNIATATTSVAGTAAAPIATPPPTGTTMTLSIPKLGVTSPIVIPTDTSTQGVLKSLEGGVGMYPGSVMPGQNGHTILLGHSSRASWYHGDYAHVFSLLEQLKVGDEFVITAGTTKYVYRVFQNKVFKPAAEDVYLSGAATGSEVDLSTCDPVGSAANRRLISATLIAAGE